MGELKNFGPEVKFHDTTLRDGIQSNWGMIASYWMIEKSLGEILQAGYDTVEFMGGWTASLLNLRLFGEDPREYFGICKRYLKETNAKVQSGCTLGMMTDIFSPPECIGIVRLYNKVWLEQIGGRCDYVFLQTDVRDEVENEFQHLVPMYRSLGTEPIPYVTFMPIKWRTDEWYVNKVKKVIDVMHPVEIALKDVDGLLSPERAHTLLPAFIEAAGDVPVKLHSHGMSGQNSRVHEIAMEYGFRKFDTCIPPLAYGSAHVDIHDDIRNAKSLGLQPQAIDMERVQKVSDRLRTMGVQAGLPIDNHVLPFDLGVYKHQIPGGVKGTLIQQLTQMKMGDKYEEVADETARIVEEMGNPPMITPHSQYIVAQATLNVATGERWSEILDSVVAYAVGAMGVHDTGLEYMDPNLRDKLLSQPSAKKIKEDYEKQKEYLAWDPPVSELKAKYGKSDASDLEFVEFLALKGDEARKGIIPGGPANYVNYLTGEEPLPEIMDALKKDSKLNGLQVYRGDKVFTINMLK